MPRNNNHTATKQRKPPQDDFPNVATLRTGLLRQASQINGSEFGSGRPFHTVSQIPPAFSAGSIKNFNGERHLQLPILGNLSTIGFAKVSLPCAMSFRSSIHSGKQVQFEAGGGSVDFIKDLLQENLNPVPGRRFDYAPVSFQENRNFAFDRRSLYQPNLETNADIVHIKLMRNNAFVTVTDSKGNKKTGISTGKLAGKGAKLARYSADAAAENMRREVRKMKTKSVVVKVNGFTFFRKKKDAILNFKDGYTNSRGDANPIVFIEDTTRKPHNGCRLKKKRRI